MSESVRTRVNVRMYERWMWKYFFVFCFFSFFFLFLREFLESPGVIGLMMTMLCHILIEYDAHFWGDVGDVVQSGLLHLWPDVPLMIDVGSPGFGSFNFLDGVCNPIWVDWIFWWWTLLCPMLIEYVAHFLRWRRWRCCTERFAPPLAWLVPLIKNWGCIFCLSGGCTLWVGL